MNSKPFQILSMRSHLKKECLVDLHQNDNKLNFNIAKKKQLCINFHSYIDCTTLDAVFMPSQTENESEHREYL